MVRVRMIMISVRSRWTTGGAVLLAFMLAGCLGDRATSGIGNEPLSGRTAPAPTPAPRAAALADMAGRWQLAQPGAGACGMRFSGTPGALEGTIAPEGGCPGKFFTSRRWAFDQDALVIRDHTGERLARLAMSAPGHFEGQAATGEVVSLTQ